MSVGFSNKDGTVSLDAAANLSANQFHAVKATSGVATLCGSAGELAIGILLNDPAAEGRAASIQVSGVAPALAGGTVAAMDKITTDANGHLIKTTTGDHYVLGIALEGADSGERFALLITHVTVP